MTAPVDAVLDDAATAFLGSHTWAILATGRRDGSPQQSMVGYAVLDDGRIAMSVKSYTAKWRNLGRLPRASLAVADGREHLVLSGHERVRRRPPSRRLHRGDHRRRRSRHLHGRSLIPSGAARAVRRQTVSTIAPDTSPADSRRSASLACASGSTSISVRIGISAASASSSVQSARVTFATDRSVRSHHRSS